MATPPWRTAGGGTAVQRPSFHPVSVRKSLGKPNTNFNSSTSMQSNPARRTQFPDALKAYVARTFEDCPAESKPEVEIALKKIITDAFENDTVWSIDWANHPLPLAARVKNLSSQKWPSPDRMDISSSSDDASSTPVRSIITGKFSKIGPGEKRKLSSRISSETTIETDRDFHSVRPDKRSRKSLQTSDYSYEGPDAFKRLDKRYKKHQATNVFSRYNAMSTALDLSDYPAVVGRSKQLEKRYLRLTSAPDPDTVRPLAVLEKTLELLKSKWKSENNYSYICDQFKSVRQDLTVQHIKNEFTINVYEIHARIALEKGDLGEYNQCQSQLANLYQEKIPGGHQHEFKAYRILYLLHTCNRSDMNDILASLTPTEKSNKAVLHALAVRSALAAGNYHRFFRLYMDAPNMGGYLMDSFIERERLAALCSICKAYRPDIPLRHITEELGFENDEECHAFIVKNNGEAFLETKKDETKLQTQKALPTFQTGRAAAFRKVDIKGQI